MVTNIKLSVHFLNLNISEAHFFSVELHIDIPEKK